MVDSSLRDSVGYQLVKTAKAHRRRLAAALEALDLHVGQELALVALAGSAGLRQSELAERLGVEPPTVTKTLRNLEDSGLIERSEDPDDARAQQVVLTERGEDLVGEIESAWGTVEASMLEGITDEERLLLRRLLLQIRRNLGPGDGPG